MMKNEKGMTFLPILFFTTLILLYLSESVPRVLSSRQSLQAEWGKLQAERNAEAGIFLAMEDWNQNLVPFSGKSYALSSGMAQVTVKKQSDIVIQITSNGSYDTQYKDKIIALYDTKQIRWIDWTR